MNKINKIEEPQRHREQTNSCQRGVGLGEGEKRKESKQKKLIDADNSTVITREEGGGGDRKW